MHFFANFFFKDFMIFNPRNSFETNYRGPLRYWGFQGKNMAIELKVPTVGESITEVMIGEWLKKEGEFAAVDEPVVVIETDKVNVELDPQTQAIVDTVNGAGVVTSLL